MARSKSRELDSLLLNKILDLRKFQTEQKGVWLVVNGAYLSVRSMIGVTVAASNESHPTRPVTLSLWQSVLQYQMESFFLLISRGLDEGIALLRMAAELARDVARIGDDPGRLNTWLNRRKGEKKAYRHNF